MGTKGSPPDSLNPSESPKKAGLWLSSPEDVAPPCVPPREVTAAWRGPTGQCIQPLLPGSPYTAFSLLSYPSLSSACKHVHTSQGHTHMAPAPGSHTQKTVWAPCCTPSLKRGQAPLLSGRKWGVHAGLCHTRMQSNAVGHRHPDHCGHSRQRRHWAMRAQKHGDTHMHSSRPSHVHTSTHTDT